MTYPWMKKNPLMSMLLAGVNAVIGCVRVQATAKARAVLTKQVAQFWSGTRLAKPKRRK